MAQSLELDLEQSERQFLLNPVLPHFTNDLTGALFAIVFPVADLILLASIAAIALMDAYSPRNAIVLLGIAVFTITDFLFLALTIRGKYSFGELSDDGWLLGLILISEGLWHRTNDQKKSSSLHLVFIALSVMTSAIFLAITSLRPGYLPDYIVIPTVATLGLAFIRMTIALREARSIGEERTLARTDELTGLPNRRRFIAELNALSQDPKREGALLLLDLDGFKPINDQFGHDIGDQLLRQVSIRFQRALPHGALLARLGGDEFGALILGNYEATLEVALALKATVSYPFILSGEEIMVGVSVGHVNNDGKADLLRRADQAMYQAKREGVGVWSEPSRSRSNNF
ncbi:MAG: GGDEF domain-containing protein [Actinomycetota bacterium]